MPARPLRHLPLALVPLLLLPSTLTLAQTTPIPDFTSPHLWRPAAVPFSFQYGGIPSASLLPHWRFASKRTRLPNGFTLTRYTYTDPVHHLRVTADLRTFPDSPGTADWVLHLENLGSADTPLIEDLLPLHSSLPTNVTAASPALVRHAAGSLARADDFRPLEEQLGPGSSDHLQSQSGDSSSGDSLPFFNLQLGTHGLVAAVGWTGNWKADLKTSPDGRQLTLAAGMPHTHFVLHPHEFVRTPRIVLMPWSTDAGNTPPTLTQSSATTPATNPDQPWQDAQNAWRRLLLAYYTPQENGQPRRGPVLAGSWGSEPIAAKEAFVDWIHTNHIPISVYAVDAGWYGHSVGAENDGTNPWYQNRGDWYPSPLYFPHGLAPLGDLLHADGIGFSLWLEPEVSVIGRQMIREHPSWFLHTDHPQFTAGFSSPDIALANLGDPATLAGLTRFISTWITTNRVTWFRQDFNIPPERYWQLADTPDRVGITEMKYIAGLYTMWDTLLAEHPGLHIDNCASGGRRLDIETIARSFLVWRTDLGYTNPLAVQAQTTALNPWIPENMAFESLFLQHPWTQIPPSPTPSQPATAQTSTPHPPPGHRTSPEVATAPNPYSTPANLYLLRLAYSTGFGTRPGDTGVSNQTWIAFVQQFIAEYRDIQPFLYANTYPLVPYSLAPDTWTATQWNRPANRDGIVLLLRRPSSPTASFTLNLRHLDPTARYLVEIRTTLQHAPTQILTGDALTHLAVTLPQAPSSAILLYHQLTPTTP